MKPSTNNETNPKPPKFILALYYLMTLSLNELEALNLWGETTILAQRIEALGG